MVGHSYIVYAPLIYGCPSILYEGKPVGTPDAGAYWRVIAQHGVSAMFTAPTAFRAIKRDDPDATLLADYDISCFDTLFLAGERTDPDTLGWAERHLERPVFDHWWQTESGWPMGANCAGLGALPVKPGSPTKPVPGYRIEVVDEAGTQVPPGDIGSIVVKQPLPPGFTPTLWNNDARFEEAYFKRFPGYYLTGDAGVIDEDGYLWIMSRTDDIINVAGHRLSTGAMEEVLAAHQDVAECAVVGVADALKGQLKSGVNRPRRDRGGARAHGARDHRPGRRLQAGGGGGAPAEDPLGQDSARHHVADGEEVPGDDPEEIVAGARAHGARDHRPSEDTVAAFKQAAVVERLPKTRSGKILRGTIAKIADGEEVKIPATIDDPADLGRDRRRDSPARLRRPASRGLVQNSCLVHGSHGPEMLRT